MPAKSEKQLRLIWAIRRKYKTKTKTPKKWKWVWGEEWTHLQKESFILRFEEFINGSILTEDDRELVEDLVVGLADKYFLSFDGGKGNKGYVSVQFFKIHPDAIQFGIQLNEEFDNEKKTSIRRRLGIDIKKNRTFWL